MKLFVKLASAFIQNQRNRQKLRLLFWLSAVIYLLAIPGTAADNYWELIPENPVVGDTIEIRGANFTGETAEVRVSFEKDVRVLDGKYEYLLEDVKISPGFSNRFSVQAKGAEDLNVRVKMILWITRTAKAKTGSATVSQSGVPPGNYRIRIDGKSNASDVKLRITGLQQVKVDSGNFSYKYDTKSIPAGIFEIKAGNVTKQVTLQPAENLLSNTTHPSEQKEDRKEEFSRDWKAWKTWNIWIKGILNGVILLLIYSRIKKR